MMTMEGNDVFAGQGTEVGEDDPFAGGDDWSDFGNEPSAPTEAPTPPVVDREGQPVTPSDSRSELERKEDAYQYAMSHGEPISVELQEAHEAFLRERDEQEWAAAAPAGTAEEIAEPEQPQYEKPEVADATPEQVERVEGAEQAMPTEARVQAEEPPESAQAPVSGDAGGVDAPQVPSDPQEAAEHGAGAAEAMGADQGDVDPGDTQPEGVADDGTPAEEDAPPPEERTDAKGKTTHRRYYVLQLTGAGKFEQVSWYEDAEGNMVTRGTEGSKRQTVALVRGAEDALKVGYAALGSPREGVQLVAVAALHFQPRTVKPKPVEPVRTRLEIS